MSRLKFKILFYLPFSHSLSYLSWRSWWFENILSNTRHLEDPKVKRRKMWSPELHIACHVWNWKCLLTFHFSISSHIYHEFHDYLRIFFQIQVISRTLKSKEGIILFPIFNHIHHDDNDNLIIFFQIQDIWRTLKSKEGRYGALNFT